MLERMTSQQLTEWMMFYQMEPFGEERADLRAGIIASVIANCNRDPKRKPEPFRAADFMPDFGEPKPKKVVKRQTVAEQLAIVEMLNMAFGGEDLRVKQDQQCPS